MKEYKQYLVPGLIILTYLVTHLVRLTALPVFADEAIYIRWAQLIMDSREYLLFPLNDGKTPLFIWSMVPFQYLINDPLWAGRFVSVLVGLGQLVVTYFLVLEMGGKKRTGWISAVLVTILPFWFFHHRMALMDSMLVLFLSLTLLGVVKMTREKSLLLPAAIVSTVFGLALWTKLPAVIFAPIFYLWLGQMPKLEKDELIRRVIVLSIALGWGGAFFFLLKLHPAFPQLFSRGSDFLFPLNDILSGKWLQTIQNLPAYFSYFWQYLTGSLFVITIVSLFSKKYQKQIHFSFWSGFIFIAPIAIMGKVVYPRYLLPAAIFFTLAGTFAIEALISRVERESKLWLKLVLGMLVASLVASVVSQSITFDGSLIFSPDETLFVSADREQYLTEWSSGHGIKPVVDKIQQTAENEKVAVATEGHFGTLPDGILMYLHRQNVDNIYVEGIGHPVNDIDDDFIKKAQDQGAEKYWLVVNSHRMQVQGLDPDWQIERYCRPYQAPCLELWDITPYVKERYGSHNRAQSQ